MTHQCHRCKTQVNAIQRKKLGIFCDMCYIEFLEEFLGEIHKWMELNVHVLKAYCFNDHLDDWTIKNVPEITDINKRLLH